MHVSSFRSLAALVPAAVLFACNSEGPAPAAAPPEEDIHHERSFAWDSPAQPPALARIAARETHFNDAEEFARVLTDLDVALERREVSDSLWKPLDHAFDELDLALWNTYGTVHVAGKLVLDEATLRARCTPMAEGDGADALGKAASAYGPLEATHRVYPYKMIGRSWDNYDLVVYKSTGAETQFKKHRSKMWVTAWWDTDASRIGVRAYLFDCGISNSTRTCRHSSARTTTARNDDYVAARDFSAGMKVTYTFPGTFSASPTTLNAADAAVGMHAVDHAGIAFRAQSSSGLYDPVTVVNLPGLSHVTW